MGRTVKRFILTASAIAGILSLAACGVSTEDFEAAQASHAAVASEKEALQVQLEDTQAQLALAQDEAEELRAAEEERVAAQEAEEARKAKEKEDREAAAAAEKAKANKAKKVTKRALAQIVKQPDSHIDENVIIYGLVTQFDSATGSCTFRAELSHAQVGKYDYEHNSMFTAGDGLADCDALDDIVAEDIVQITATVTGSLSYDTTIGGSTTVPKFQVVKIKRL
jgi:flagellar biosynthesis GTPase FlhF